MNDRGWLMTFDMFIAEKVWQLRQDPKLLGAFVRSFIKQTGCPWNFFELCSYYRLTNKSAAK